MGKEEISLDLDSSKHYSIKDVLREISRSEGKELSTLSNGQEEIPLRTVRVVLNGKIIHSLEGLETVVQDGDCIAIFPLLAAG